MTKKKQNERCYYCGEVEFETRHVRYIYSREGKDLLVPDMPVEVCSTCGMIYYDGLALLKVEARFESIYHSNAKPDRYTTLPVFEYV